MLNKLRIIFVLIFPFKAERALERREQLVSLNLYYFTYQIAELE
jgi:hypothetical protein